MAHIPCTLLNEYLVVDCHDVCYAPFTLDENAVVVEAIKGK